MQLAKSLQQIQPSYIREILNAASADNVISLAGGLPDADNFPLSLMAPALLKLPEQASLFQYGNTAGYAPLLRFFEQHYQLADNHEAIVCTGSQQGLDLIARAFINPNDNIVMEAPSYLGALQVFGLAQANIHSISQQQDGPNLQELEAYFAQHDITLFYAVPDFHNPTGVCWSLKVRQKVAQLCQQYDVALIEDVPYRELRFSGNALPLVSSFCPDQALVLRSFSKIATPGIRLGLVTGKSPWLQALIKVKQSADLHSSIPMQAILLSLLQHEEFDNHLKNLRLIYQIRYQRLIEQIKFKLPQCQFSQISGGMFIWLEIPNCDVYKLAQQALKNGVAVVPSTVFYQEDNTKNKTALRLNFTNAQPDELNIAIDRLARTLNDIT